MTKKKMSREEKLVWYKEQFEDIHKSIKNKDKISYLDFLRIRNFKLQNSSPEKEEESNKITEKAFTLAKDDKIKEAIKELTELNGVAIPIASTILAMKFPETYAIIDRNVIRALNKEEWLKDYLKNEQTYEKYLKLMRSNAKSKGMKLREYERKLFEGKDSTLPNKE
jgi:hypothetical protein